MKYKQRKEIKKRLKTIFVTGTAGSGKSSLTSKLVEYYTRNGANAAVLNLDPGVESMPYNCDVDVRELCGLCFNNATVQFGTKWSTSNGK